MGCRTNFPGLILSGRMDSRRELFPALRVEPGLDPLEKELIRHLLNFAGNGNRSGATRVMLGNTARFLGSPIKCTVRISKCVAIYRRIYGSEGRRQKIHHAAIWLIETRIGIHNRLIKRIS